MYFSRLRWLILLLLLPPIAQYSLSLARRRRRRRLIPHAKERIIIIGASSGIGREIAHQYAARDAFVCIVGRREDKLEAVRNECADLLPSRDHAKIIQISADCSDPAEMLRIKDYVVKEWNGIDTVIVSAGVSALSPLLAIAGEDPRAVSTSGPNLEGLTRVRDVSSAAFQGNFMGPLLSAVAFVPLLTRSSSSPALLLISSIAAVIPAPTRTLYAASKGASLLLYQALSIEHPEIKFTSVIPYTVEGDFRASAVDGGMIRENLTKVSPKIHSLKKKDVARDCIYAVDTGARTVWLPGTFRLAHLLYWIIPAAIDAGARRKYNFKA
ncbi:hypothetical protein BU17DRAFT_42128 [Hysterangium stoloniferum]|nr:hypothetical protein BU17DRAFT_42128 [Hysterangium stoloniferum]